MVSKVGLNNFLPSLFYVSSLLYIKLSVRTHGSHMFRCPLWNHLTSATQKNGQKWIRRFERFRLASGLAEKGEETQVNLLIYLMGDEINDILCSLDLTLDHRKKYSPVKDKFSVTVKRRNVIFEGAKFNMRKQEGEPVDAFTTDLYSLSEHHAYGTLHNEMIRDRIVAGIRNSALSERLQLDAALTLVSALTQVRQAEALKLQQLLLRAGYSGGKLETRLCGEKRERYPVPKS